MVSRWLAKIANYLTNELAADLFGAGEPTPTRIYTTLQPWQDALWQIAARAMGWEVLDTRRPLPGDLFVTNTLGSDASDALDAGAHVLAQPAQYLSFAWDGPLDGALDGLAEIATQPDALVVDTPPRPRRGTGWDTPVGAGSGSPRRAPVGRAHGRGPSAGSVDAGTLCRRH